MLRTSPSSRSNATEVPFTLSGRHSEYQQAIQASVERTSPTSHSPKPRSPTQTGTILSTSHGKTLDLTPQTVQRALQNRGLRSSSQLHDSLPSPQGDALCLTRELVHHALKPRKLSGPRAEQMQVETSSGGIKRFNCRYCLAILSSTMDLELHIRRNHPDIAKLK